MYWVLKFLDLTHLSLMLLWLLMKIERIFDEVSIDKMMLRCYWNDIIIIETDNVVEIIDVDIVIVEIVEIVKIVVFFLNELKKELDLLLWVKWRWSLSLILVFFFFFLKCFHSFFSLCFLSLSLNFSLFSAVFSRI